MNDPSDMSEQYQQDADAMASMYDTVFDVDGTEADTGSTGTTGGGGGAAADLASTDADAGAGGDGADDTAAGDDGKGGDAAAAAKPDGDGGNDSKAAGAGTGDAAAGADGKQSDPEASSIPLNRHKDILKNAQSRIDALEEQLSELRGKAATTKTEAAIDDIEEKIAWIKENMPEPVAELFEAQHRQLVESRTEAQRLRESVEQREVQNQRQSTQQIIDQVPTLKAWQSKGGVLWNAALDIDKELRDSGEWDDRNPAERFRAVVKRVAADVGIDPAALQLEIAKQSGAAAASPAPAAAGAGGKKTPTESDQVDAGVPSTMSALPKGQAPAETASQDIDGMDQLEAFNYLSRLPAHEQERLLMGGT